MLKSCSTSRVGPHSTKLWSTWANVWPTTDRFRPELVDVVQISVDVGRSRPSVSQSPTRPAKIDQDVTSVAQSCSTSVASLPNLAKKCLGRPEVHDFGPNLSTRNNFWTTACATSCARNGNTHLHIASTRLRANFELVVWEVRPVIGTQGSEEDQKWCHRGRNSVGGG